MINCEPYVVVDYITFEKGMMGDLDKFIEDLDEISKAVKAAVGYKWAHGNTKFSNIYGETFKFGLYKDTNLVTKKTKYTLSVWDNTGTISIISDIVPEDSKERKSFVNKTVEFTEEFAAGKIHCSDCGKLENYHEVRSNRYFASTFCDRCWDGKWKKIEAKETYN